MRNRQARRRSKSSEARARSCSRSCRVTKASTVAEVHLDVAADRAADVIGHLLALVPGSRSRRSTSARSLWLAASFGGFGRRPARVRADQPARRVTTPASSGSSVANLSEASMPTWRRDEDAVRLLAKDVSVAVDAERPESEERTRLTGAPATLFLFNVFAGAEGGLNMGALQRDAVEAQRGNRVALARLRRVLPHVPRVRASRRPQPSRPRLTSPRRPAGRAPRRCRRARAPSRRRSDPAHPLAGSQQGRSALLGRSCRWWSR